MKKATDHPGVYVPPPLIYAAIFFLSLLLQRIWPIEKHFLSDSTMRICGTAFIASGLLFNIPALVQFFRTHNTVITIKAATTLQTGGIYAISRNPMYLSLLLIYTGIGFFAGNTWTFLLIPLLVFIITRYVIFREERYLERTFGQAYKDYRKKVRRWI